MWLLGALLLGLAIDLWVESEREGRGRDYCAKGRKQERSNLGDAVWILAFLGAMMWLAGCVK